MTRARRWLFGAVSVALFVVLGGPIGTALRETSSVSELPRDVAGRWVVTLGHRTHVVEAGEGPPLVLVHGFAGSTYDYEEHTLALLALHHHVVAVDLFGNGWSDRDASFAYGWGLWGDQLVAVLDALDLPRASFVGHSMGGGAITVLAARRPERVDRLILADALYPLEDDEISTVFRVMSTPVLGPLALGLVGDLSPPGASDASRARTRRTSALGGTRHGLLTYLRDPTRRSDLAAAYANVLAPVLVVHGTADTFVPIAAMERATPALANAQIVRLSGGGHFPHRDTPERLVHEIDAFVP